jgi:hypothetical protein
VAQAIRSVIKEVSRNMQVNHMTRKGLLIITVLMALGVIGVTFAQAQGAQPSGPTYVGSETCKTCHNNDKAQAPQTPAETLQKLIDDQQKDTTDRVAALEKRLKALSDKNNDWMDTRTNAPATEAPMDFKAAFTNISFVKADSSKGFHNYQYAKAVLDEADGDLKKLEQPPAPATVPPTIEPTATPVPTATLAPTATPEPPRGDPGTSWAIWGGLAAVVVIFLGVLYLRKPKTS